LIESFHLSGASLRAGIIAMAAFLVIIIVSLRPVRTGAYEVFFYIHFLGIGWV